MISKRAVFLRRVLRSLVALSLPLIGWCVFSSAGRAEAQTERAPAVERAPNFVRTDLKHQKVELSRYRGKVVLLNFWASWCPPCLVEMPTFALWQRQYGPEGLQVIGVSFDDTVKAASSAADRLKIDYPVVMGDAGLGSAYGGVLGLPMSFLIDRKGNIRGRYQGMEPARLKAEMLRLLTAK